VTLARVVELLAETMSRTGPYAPLVLFGASFTEHVFPPFPGDALVVLGAWYAVQGSLSWPATFAAVTAGAIAGAALDWKIGRVLGPRVEARAAARGESSSLRLARFEAAYRRWGPWILVANRFLPGLRATFFLVAGACRVPLREVVVFGGLSAALWNGALLAAGALLVKNLDELGLLVGRYTRAVWIVLAALALAVAVRVAWKRRRRRAAG
jgi:membrane-associated protein